MIAPADRTKQISEYYFSKKLREISSLQKEGKPIINLGIGSPDLSPDDQVIQTLKQGADDPNAHGYQSYQGLPALRDAIKSFYQRKYHKDISTLEVLPLMGSKEGITHVSLAYLNPGDEVLIPELGYPTYTSVTKMVGAKPVHYPLVDTSWEPDWDELSKLDTSRVKLMWLNYPHMPTGVKASVAQLERFVAFAKERSILICYDNPYSFLGNDQPLSIFNVEGALEIALELSSVSKTFNMAGWRLGWVAGNEQLVQPVLQIMSNMSSGMFRPIQEAAIAALQLGDEWYGKLNEVYTKRRNIGQRIFDLLGCAYDPNQAGMFIWAKSSSSGEELSDKLLNDYDVFIAPGFIFGEKGYGYVRMSLCAPESKLEEVLNRIK